jgi:cell division protein FtsZ
MSGEDEELSMDELSEITEYIQEKAGDNAEVIFGQGIDPELGKAIRVTVIATGFEMDRLDGLKRAEMKTHLPTPVIAPSVIEKAPETEAVKTVINLDSGKSEKVKEEAVGNGSTFVFSFPKTAPLEEKPVEKKIEAKNENKEVEPEFKFEAKPKQDEKSEFEFVKPEEEKIVHDLYEEEDKNEPQPNKEESEPAAPLFANDYYEQMKQKAIQRAHERFEKLRGNRTFNPTPEELKEKMEVPAYQRKNVKLNEPQHSSEENISKFNLNDDNEILGNNRFLHDNVD